LRSTTHEQTLDPATITKSCRDLVGLSDTAAKLIEGKNFAFLATISVYRDPKHQVSIIER
jgi:hypothetical protein